MGGVLVQKYGPHVFFTDDHSIEQYVRKFSNVEHFFPQCRTYIGGQFVPIPFNFASIDMIYDKDDAESLKSSLQKKFEGKEVVSVLDVINSAEKNIHDYGTYMYEHEYRKYTSKQWNLPIEEIDPSIFTRVPVYMSYKKEYEKHNNQFIPEGGFTQLVKKILDHDNISVELNVDGILRIFMDEKAGRCRYKELDGSFMDIPIVYTGPLDELFSNKFGYLPYRSLEFIWKVVDSEDAPETELTAYPEGDKYIRITDYSRFPRQESGGKSVLAIEVPVEYKKAELFGNEPYYPVLKDESKQLYERYRNESIKYENLYCCGRLAEFKYYNMDTVINNAGKVAQKIENDFQNRS